VGVSVRRLEVRRRDTGDLLGAAVFEASCEETVALARCMNYAHWPSAIEASIVDMLELPAPPPPADDDPQPFVVGER
jgi:hypothetical protein